MPKTAIMRPRNVTALFIAAVNLPDVLSIGYVGGNAKSSTAGIIFFNGTRILRPAIADLMDHAPESALTKAVEVAARSVTGVEAIEKLKMRKAGMGYFVDLHVQANPFISLRDAHILSGRVKSAIRVAVPSVLGVLVHMEPFQAASLVAPAEPRRSG